jgi:hypothetical protein
MTLLTLLGPATLPSVVANLNAPQTVGSCSSVTLDASLSTGLQSPSVPLVNIWTIVAASPPLSSTSTSDIAAFLQNLGTAKIVVPATLLPAGRTFTFQVRVADRLGSFSVASVSVAKSALPLLPIFLSGLPFLVINRMQAYEMSASTLTQLGGSCLDPATVKDLALTFRWQMMSSIPTNFSVGGVILSPSGVAWGAATASALMQTVPALQQPSAQLRIPPFVLSVNATYVFQVALRVTVTIAGTPTVLDSSSTVAVQVQPSALIARISGGDRTVYGDPSGPNVVVDGTCGGREVHDGKACA